MSTSLASLAPDFRPFAEYLVKVAKTLGPTVVTSTRRSWVEQQRLWVDYMSGKRALPAVPPNQSLHTRGWAVDLVVGSGYEAGGPPTPEMAALGRWWQQSGGRWGGVKDPVHYEAPW